MEIVDNFLPEKDFKSLQQLFYLSNTIPYFLGYPVATAESDDGMFMIHHLYEKDVPLSDRFEMVKDLFFKHLDYKSLIRAKVNLFPRTNKVYQHDWHVDYDFKHNNAVLYLNDNDGYTIIKDGPKVESKANRVLFLTDNEIHASSTCSDEPARYTLNVNYF